MEDSCSYMNTDTFNMHMILYDASTVSVQVA